MSERSQVNATNTLSRLDVHPYFMDYDMTIEGPIEKVWHHMIHYLDWNPAHFGAKVERLSGTENAEGEVILEHKKSGDGHAPAIIIETVKIIPNEKIVWALYMPDTGASTGIGFVDFSLASVNGKTKFTYRLYGWGNSSVVGPDRKAFQKSIMEAVGQQLPALKARVEASP
jgi:uncharacterized protein YndB with AHSA1/START domain